MNEKTMVYSSEENSDKTALEVIEELRNKDYKITYDSFSVLANRIINNKEYLRSQGTLKEVVRNLAVLLNYPKVVEKLDSLENELNLE